ncbi:hypothetical protein HK097_010995, partial [Rhizophlyctis rosea]
MGDRDRSRLPQPIPPLQTEKGQEFMRCLASVLHGVQGICTLIQENSIPGLDLSPLLPYSQLPFPPAPTYQQQQQQAVQHVSQQQAQQAQQQSIQQTQQSPEQAQPTQQAQATPSTGKAKKTKDPNAPKQPLTSYILYCQDIREQVRAEHPEFSQTEIAREMGRRWKEISEEEKRPYDEKALRKREEYNHALVAYRQRTLADNNTQPQPEETDADTLLAQTTHYSHHQHPNSANPTLLPAPQSQPASPPLTDSPPA